MGDVLQCHHLAVPGLRGPEWIWESIKSKKKLLTLSYLIINIFVGT